MKKTTFEEDRPKSSRQLKLSENTCMRQGRERKGETETEKENSSLKARGKTVHVFVTIKTSPEGNPREDMCIMSSTGTSLTLLSALLKTVKKSSI